MSATLLLPILVQTVFSSLPFPSESVDDGCDLRLFEADTCIEEWRRPKMETKRNAIRCGHWLWPQGRIPYKTELRDLSIIEKFTEAIDELNTLNCVHFREIDNGKISELGIFRKYLTVREIAPLPGRSCQATLGAIGRSPHLDLSHICTKGQIMHELMHVLGFAHEHQRPDRDRYVNVRCDHLMPNVSQDFRRLSRQVTKPFHNDGYDFTSIMHYRLDHFSLDGQRTLELVNPSYLKLMGINESEIGGMKKLSERDVRRIRWLYRC